MTRTTWPEAADEAGWATAAAAGDLRDCPPGLIVGALRARVADTDARLVEALTLHISDRVARRLRRLIGTDHADRGEDVVAESHAEVMEALFDPDSADGPDMVEHFWPRVRNRGIDAARTAGRYARHDARPQTDGGTGPAEASSLIARIQDPRKRLAFRCVREGVRDGDPRLADVCGCGLETAAEWVAEARAILTTGIEA